ncbi:uncharacterized protein F4822DRAFT_20261 [Hypoxylon trugodes]|uniref:uncharacterized protein n=1 Tax=Hypoxylon trugodes TaxID=326681 RepID=UPI002199AF04|nr:uncharacterized protein F4822DRAFT_20261 [Hypoxylon trugodes]KAI1393658.1 hypothetical protein F4822DRAFT_20261 [Hypoxylon trugodes]
MLFNKILEIFRALNDMQEFVFWCLSAISVYTIGGKLGLAEIHYDWLYTSDNRNADIVRFHGMIIKFGLGKWQDADEILIDCLNEATPGMSGDTYVQGSRPHTRNLPQLFAINDQIFKHVEVVYLAIDFVGKFEELEDSFDPSSWLWSLHLTILTSAIKYSSNCQICSSILGTLLASTFEAVGDINRSKQWTLRSFLDLMGFEDGRIPHDHSFVDNYGGLIFNSILRHRGIDNRGDDDLQDDDLSEDTETVVNNDFARPEVWSFGEADGGIELTPSLPDVHDYTSTYHRYTFLFSHGYWDRGV